MGLTYQFEGKNFQVISCDDLPDHRVKIAYIFDGESRESVVENRKGLLPFLANLLGLDADDSIDKNTLRMHMYTDPIIFPLFVEIYYSFILHFHDLYQYPLEVCLLYFL